MLEASLFNMGVCHSIILLLSSSLRTIIIHVLSEQLEDFETFFCAKGGVVQHAIHHVNVFGTLE